MVEYSWNGICLGSKAEELQTSVWTQRDRHKGWYLLLSCNRKNMQRPPRGTEKRPAVTCDENKGETEYLWTQCQLNSLMGTVGLPGTN